MICQIIFPNFYSFINKYINKSLTFWWFFKIFRQFNRLYNLSSFRYNFWLDVRLELTECIPFSTYFFILHIVELFDRTVVMRKFIDEIIFKLHKMIVTFLLCIPSFSLNLLDSSQFFLYFKCMIDFWLTNSRSNPTSPSFQLLWLSRKFSNILICFFCLKITIIIHYCLILLGKNLFILHDCFFQI